MGECQGTDILKAPNPTRVCTQVLAAISSFRYLYAGMPSELQRQHQRYTKYSFNRDECMTWTCLFGTGPMDESFTQCKQLAICPKCQREYAAVDFAAIHDKLMRYLRREGVKIDDVGKAP